jgi:peptide deformylase
MLETMYDAPGVGLAANQIGLLERIIVVDTDYDYQELEEGEVPPEGAEVMGGGIISGKNPRIIINPEIIRREGKVMSKEGCLSVPEFTAEVERAKIITVQYLDVDGVMRKLDAEGLFSMCIQHEMDHLEGRLFIDRLGPAKKELAKKKLLAERAAREAAGDEGPGSDLYDMGMPKGRG